MGFCSANGRARVVGLTPNRLTPTWLRMKPVLEPRWPSRRGVSFCCAVALKRHDVSMASSSPKVLSHQGAGLEFTFDQQ